MEKDNMVDETEWKRWKAAWMALGIRVTGGEVRMLVNRPLCIATFKDPDFHLKPAKERVRKVREYLNTPAMPQDKDDESSWDA